MFLLVFFKLVCFDYFDGFLMGLVVVVVNFLEFLCYLLVCLDYFDLIVFLCFFEGLVIDSYLIIDNEEFCGEKVF